MRALAASAAGPGPDPGPAGSVPPSYTNAAIVQVPLASRRTARRLRGGIVSGQTMPARNRLSEEAIVAPQWGIGSVAVSRVKAFCAGIRGLAVGEKCLKFSFFQILPRHAKN